MLDFAAGDVFCELAARQGKIDAQAVIPGVVAVALVPAGVAVLVGVQVAVYVEQLSIVEDVAQILALGRGCLVGAFEPRGLVDVAVGGGYVEVAGDQQRVVMVVAGLVGDRLEKCQLARVVEFFARGTGGYVYRAECEPRAGRLKPASLCQVMLARERTAAVRDAVVFAYQDRHPAVAPARAMLGAVAELLQAPVREVTERAARLLQTHHVGALPAQHLGDARHPGANPVDVPADDSEPLRVVCGHRCGSPRGGLSQWRRRLRADAPIPLL